jgi:hypothetical protein
MLTVEDGEVNPVDEESPGTLLSSKCLSLNRSGIPEFFSGSGCSRGWCGCFSWGSSILIAVHTTLSSFLTIFQQDDIVKKLYTSLFS